MEKAENLENDLENRHYYKTESGTFCMSEHEHELYLEQLELRKAAESEEKEQKAH